MNNDLILIGKIIGVFGIKGELKVYSESDFIETRFKKGAHIVLKNKKVSKEATVSSMRIHKKTILITIDNLFDINKVEKKKVVLKVYFFYLFYSEKIDFSFSLCYNKEK